MATRALIGYLENGVLTTTYNHYDGYPENLGKALNNFFNSPTLAKDLANYGYISYINPETGEIEAKHQESPDKVNLNKMDSEVAVEEVASLVDSYGADYAYFYSPNASNWDVVKNNGIRSMMDSLEGILFGDFDNTYDEEEMAENYQSKWKKFLNEEANMGEPTYGEDKNVLINALYQLQDQPLSLLNSYKESLANDMRINGPEAYADYTEDDFIADYDNWSTDHD